MRVFRPRLIVNAVRTAEDVKLGFAVASVCKKYFGIEVEYLGYVNYDDEARKSVSLRRPIVDLRSDADVSIYLQRIARKLLEPAPNPVAPPLADRTPSDRTKVGQTTPQPSTGNVPGFSRG
jgi:MinD-like ATPase involved in chromosome partitioning or flagellar assembly